ncbi:Hypothetical protein CINCED_3A006249 [Cinara cedri]|uniref:Uncharacterized protein n=1 Tax=Cinara cedri TaxID=506608 RepID=A0A5E4MJ80_9HEMI|nr:Hypothetical protein CINCED_3A006249 [Cinara cedri]
MAVSHRRSAALSRAKSRRQPTRKLNNIRFRYLLFAEKFRYLKNNCNFGISTKAVPVYLLKDECLISGRYVLISFRNNPSRKRFNEFSDQ